MPWLPDAEHACDWPASDPAPGRSASYFDLEDLSPANTLPPALPRAANAPGGFGAKRRGSRSRPLGPLWGKDALSSGADEEIEFAAGGARARLLVHAKRRRRTGIADFSGGRAPGTSVKSPADGVNPFPAQIESEPHKPWPSLISARRTIRERPSIPSSISPASNHRSAGFFSRRRYGADAKLGTTFRSTAPRQCTRE